MDYTAEDCKKETNEHIEYVRFYLNKFSKGLESRAREHDQSKLQEPELSTFVKFTPKLAQCEFGSDEYKKNLKGMGVALKHHYKNNSHHPEHYENGIEGMDLLDLVEMFCDWQAASLRHKGGDLEKSIDINQKRFGYSDELKQILKNSVKIIK